MTPARISVLISVNVGGGGVCHRAGHGLGFSRTGAASPAVEGPRKPGRSRPRQAARVRTGGHSLSVIRIRPSPVTTAPLAVTATKPRLTSFAR